MERKPQKCPQCGKVYTEYPAISRKDGAEICPECGQREALEAWARYMEQKKEGGANNA